MALSITVIVCTRNRPAVLDDLAGDLLPQLDPGDRLLLVDQSDDDALNINRAAVDAWDSPRVRHVLDEARGLPAGRNLGVSLATTPLVWFVDDDMRIRPSAVAAMRRAFADPAVGGAVGRIEERRVRLHPGPPRLAVGWDGRVRQRVVGLTPAAARMLPGNSFAARSVALRGIGPCDAGYGGTAFLEDADWSTRLLRAGWRLIYVPGAVSVHLAVGYAGCRAPDRPTYDRWRFHNTARWLRRHRPVGAVASVPAFTALAARAAWRGGDMGRAAALCRAFVQGWRSGSSPPESGRGDAQFAERSVAGAGSEDSMGSG